MLSIEMGKATLWVSEFLAPFVSRGCATLVHNDKIGVNTQRNENIGVKAMKDYCVLGLLSQC
jgi:hypothetical protein